MVYVIYRPVWLVMLRDRAPSRIQESNYENAKWKDHNSRAISHFSKMAKPKFGFLRRVIDREKTRIRGRFPKKKTFKNEII